jgi:sulfide:quinone oxidoreductase
MTAGRISRAARLMLVTPEPVPFALFGVDAAEHVLGLLTQADIELRVGVGAELDDAHTLVLQPGGERLRADRIVALPRVRGPRIEGLPADEDGFIPVDPHGGVHGAPHVHAAGDVTNFPLKQGGLACQQADAAAESVAALAGASIQPEPFRPVLRGALATGATPYFMRSSLSGRAEGDEAGAVQPLWWPPAKVAGRRLAPFLAALTRRQPPRRFAVNVRGGTGRDVMSIDRLSPPPRRRAG